MAAPNSSGNSPYWQDFEYCCTLDFCEAKRKVQAQRKFAVGVNVPNTNRQQPNTERRTGKLSNNPQVTQINSSLKSALDIIAFQAMHSHKQPYVLLERLNYDNMPLQGTEMRSNPREFDQAEIASYSLQTQDTAEELPHGSNDTPTLMDPLSDYAVKSSYSPPRQDTVEDSPHCSNYTSPHVDPLSDEPSTSGYVISHEIYKEELTSNGNDPYSDPAPGISTSQDFESMIDDNMNDGIPCSPDGTPTEYYFTEVPCSTTLSQPSRQDLVKAELPHTSDHTPTCMGPVPELPHTSSHTPTCMGPVPGTSKDSDRTSAPHIRAGTSKDSERTSAPHIRSEIIDLDRTETLNQLEAEIQLLIKEEYNVNSPSEFLKQLISTIRTVEALRTNGDEGEQGTVPPKLCTSQLFKSVRDIIKFRHMVLPGRCKSCYNCSNVDLVIKASDRLARIIAQNSNRQANDDDILEYVDLTKDIPGDGDILNEKGKQLLQREGRNTRGEDVDTSQALIEPNAHMEYDDTNVAITTTNCPSISDIRPENTHETCTQINEATTSSATIEPQIATRAAYTRSSPERLGTMSMSSDDEVLATRLPTRSRRQNKRCVKEIDLELAKPLSKRRRQRTKMVNLDQIEAHITDNVPSTSHGSSRVVSSNDPLNLRDAFIFRPTRREFEDPIKYIESIMPRASEYGLCKIIPPQGFQPSCNLSETMRFQVKNQYIARMFRRWGPAAKELAAIKAIHKVPFNRPPLLGGIEVDLPELFNIVMSMGGLSKGFTSKKWSTVAEKLKCKYISRPGPRLESIYVKHLLPYEILALTEREQLLEKVSLNWKKREELMLKKSLNPLYQQRQMLGEEHEDLIAQCFETEEDLEIFNDLAETEDCVVSGRSINLRSFRKVAENMSKALLTSSDMNTVSIEEAYWDLIESGTRHVCVNAAAIDTGASCIGFPSGDDEDPYVLHPWNLKRLNKTAKNILSFLGPVMGLTVPTLHLSMIFSTTCWHRDPHGLPWIEYMHEGADRVWYGANEKENDNFQKAFKSLTPLYCQNKSVWLPSDTVMVPLKKLQQHNVTLCRVVQKPGEFIIVCPKAFSSSFTTGFSISESVCFATSAWIKTINHIFQELKDNCEPSKLSQLQLFISFANNARTPAKILKEIYPTFKVKIEEEINNRRELRKMGLRYLLAKTRTRNHPWNALDTYECAICRQKLCLSKGNGLHGRKSHLCSEHTLKVLQKFHTPEEIKSAKMLSLEIVYSNDELHDMLSNLKDRIK